MFYSTTNFPFKVSASSLVDETEIDLIDLPKLLENTDRVFDPTGKRRKSSELKNILTLRPGHLVCWRMESTDTVFDKQDFAVIPVKPGDEVLEIPQDEDNVIFLFMPDFVWNPIDTWDGYRLGRYEGYMEVEYKHTQREFTPLFLMCVDLSYLYGVKFMFWKGSSQGEATTFLVTIDKDFEGRNRVWDDLKKHCKDLEKSYSRCVKSLKVFSDGPKFNQVTKPVIPDDDDFE